MRRLRAWLGALLLTWALALAPPPALADPAGAGPGGAAAAGAAGPLLREQAAALDTSAIERFLEEVNRTWEGYGPQISLADFLRFYQGDVSEALSARAILQGLLRYLVREILANADLLLKLVVLAIVAAIMGQLQSAFEADSAGKAAYWVIYLVLVGLAVTGFGLAVATARQVMESLNNFMLAILPTLLTVLIAMGGAATAAIFQPLMVTMLSLMSSIMVTVVFPLAFLAAVVDIVSGLHEQYRLSNLAGLLRQGATVALGLVGTVFLGTVAVKGAAGAVADGLAVKTAKFVTGSFVPVIGKTLADATDLIVGSSLLLKNALGMLGAAAIFFIVSFPLLKILSIAWVYQVAGALVQPAGAGEIARMLTTMARSLHMIFAAVGMVALMFFISIVVIVGAANVTVMVR
ncbi:stage III sporulation protein AE [Symbiobacterium terraclitae]|uniref:Stage III sporulation protein AE n=1 Tax=Symbiobacterium terraclitae TaxID=557451 RepID=A0ABS4JMA3_9FIRM|nr:stage III sporulation protein AE [Symbiobacterium terraclitae]